MFSKTVMWSGKDWDIQLSYLHILESLLWQRSSATLRRDVKAQSRERL